MLESSFMRVCSLSFFHMLQCIGRYVTMHGKEQHAHLKLLLSSEHTGHKKQFLS
jgi:hypothetical protein